MTTATLDPIQRLEQFGRDHEYLSKHKQEWINEQPDRWVVVYKEELICSSEDALTAYNEACAKGVGSDMVLEFITDKPRNLIL